MPLGIERINARRLQPNDQIIFIKPLEGPDKGFAQDFLERIAAICRPIMKANHIAVMSLEEYEPNLEFVGRNFNAGEVIQLVLKAPYTGNWLPFRHVQMVMMHELAHCKQMNHSGAFWKIRNQFAEELRELWGQGYTGEGLWGRGKTLLSGQYVNSDTPNAETMPKQLCGGTFRSSKRGKRKRKAESAKPTLTYAERQQRRIAKKFGTHGIALGDDADTKLKLENGKKIKGKPKVAASARGRELRAAAALQRINQQKEEHLEDGFEREDVDDETETEYEDGDIKMGAVDLDGLELLDPEGHGVIKVCDGDDGGGDDARREMFELQQVDGASSGPATLVKQEDELITNESESPSNITSKQRTSTNSVAPLEVTTKAEQTPRSIKPSLADFPIVNAKSTPAREVSSSRPQHECQVCSMKNEPFAIVCEACSNVLDLQKVPNHWRCHSLDCGRSQYINAGDCGICGICGARKGQEVGIDAG